MSRLKMLLFALLFTVVTLLLRYALKTAFQFTGLIEFSDIMPVLTGATFLTGFMLGATLADYKESEKIPTEMAAALEIAEDMLKLLEDKGLDAKLYQGRLFAVTDTIVSWLLEGSPVSAVDKAFRELVVENKRIAPALGPAALPYFSNLYGVRKLVGRADVIRRTQNLPAGYLLMDALAFCVVSLSAISRFKNPGAEYLLIGFVTLVFAYLLQFIRDMDNPFDYKHGKGRGTEVDLLSLLEYREQAKLRLAAVEGAARNDR